jgi:hypothetical protein
MSSPDLSHLSPQDAAVAFRSYHRRYQSELASIEGDDSIEEMAGRLGPGGESAAQIISDVTRTWAVLSEALRQVLVHEDAVLHPAVTDAMQRHWDMPIPDSVSESMVLLGHEAVALAQQVDGVLSAGDWNRSATVAGGAGRTVTALDVLRQAVAAGADGLSSLRATLAAVQR